MSIEIQNKEAEKKITKDTSAEDQRYSKKKKPLIGIDPLQWLKDEEILVDEQEEKTDLETRLDETGSLQEEQHIMEAEDQMNNHEIMIEGPVTIVDVSDLHEQFKTLIKDKKPIEINCAGVEGIDAAALQLFVSLNNDAINQQLSLTWKDPSESFKQAVQLMGLKKELQLTF